MSLVGDVLTQLEVELRAAVPTLPAGTAGVERGWRPSHELQPGSLPHVFLYNVTESRDALMFLQARVRVQLSGIIVRQGSTYAQALEDYEALSDLIEANPTLTNVVEQSELALEGVEADAGGVRRGLAFTFAGWTVL